MGLSGVGETERRGGSRPGSRGGGVLTRPHVAGECTAGPRGGAAGPLSPRLCRRPPSRDAAASSGFPRRWAVTSWARRQRRDGGDGKGAPHRGRAEAGSRAGGTGPPRCLVGLHPGLGLCPMPSGAVAGDGGAAPGARQRAVPGRGSRRGPRRLHAGAEPLSGRAGARRAAPQPRRVLPEAGESGGGGERAGSDLPGRWGGIGWARLCAALPGSPRDGQSSFCAYFFGPVGGWCSAPPAGCCLCQGVRGPWACSSGSPESLVSCRGAVCG